VDVQCELDWLDSKWRSRLRKRLLDWYEQNARELPWRSVSTPYRVWVSEIMCQQTQIATVLPYFNRFLKRYPTISKLAQADESELMRMWEGLGYYRRARSLHAAAKQIVSDHNGKFPDSFDDVLALPGIGRYTAGAILSISRNQRVPILEGNTHRVFSRWIGLRQSPTEKASQAMLWEFAERMLPRTTARKDRGPAAFNQAAMELGALICTPRSPACDVCPVASVCAANRLDLQESIPGKISKVTYEARTEYALLIRDPSSHETVDRESVRWLVRTIPGGGRLEGMWDFPRGGPPEAEKLSELEDWLSKQLGGRLEAGVRLSTIKHAITKYRITLHVHEAVWRPRSRRPPPEPWKWVAVSELDGLPMSVTGRKMLRLTQQANPSLFSG